MPRFSQLCIVKSETMRPVGIDAGLAALDGDVYQIPVSQYSNKHLSEIVFDHPNVQMPMPCWFNPPEGYGKEKFVNRTLSHTR